jgi:hypothetical protein
MQASIQRQVNIMIRLLSAHCFVIPGKGIFLLQKRGLPPQELAADISRHD